MSTIQICCHGNYFSIVSICQISAQFRRETSAEVVIVAYSRASGVCLSDLQSKLQQYRSRLVKVGAFSACSNVTGILTDVDEVSILLHRHGAYAVFDYATAAPYVKVGS